MTHKPRIVALLNWYDETPSTLTRCVHSLQKTGISHLIALDGVYKHFPHTNATSPENQHTALKEAAKDISLPLNSFSVEFAFNNQVEKRNMLVCLAKHYVRDYVDFFFVIDADEEVKQWNDNAVTKMMKRDYVAANVHVQQPLSLRNDRRLHEGGVFSRGNHLRKKRLNNDNSIVFTRLIRAYPDLEYIRKHWWLSATSKEGERFGISGAGNPDPLTDNIADLTHAVKMKNSTWERDVDRLQKKNQYYANFENAGEEE